MPDIEPTAHPDAALIAACDTCQAVMDAMVLDCLESDVDLDDLCRRMYEALEEAAEMSARTLNGVLAKASLVRRDLPDAADSFALTRESGQIRLAVSLADDVLRLAV